MTSKTFKMLIISGNNKRQAESWRKDSAEKIGRTLYLDSTTDFYDDKILTEKPSGVDYPAVLKAVGPVVVIDDIPRQREYSTKVCGHVFKYGWFETYERST